MDEDEFEQVVATLNERRTPSSTMFKRKGSKLNQVVHTAGPNMLTDDTDIVPKVPTMPSKAKAFWHYT